jgi:hypothetical protein
VDKSKRRNEILSDSGWRIEKVESVNTNDLPAADKVFRGATVGVNDDSLPFEKITVEILIKLLI